MIFFVCSTVQVNTSDAIRKIFDKLVYVNSFHAEICGAIFIILSKCQLQQTVGYMYVNSW